MRSMRHAVVWLAGCLVAALPAMASGTLVPAVTVAGAGVFAELGLEPTVTPDRLSQDPTTAVGQATASTAQEAPSAADPSSNPEPTPAEEDPGESEEALDLSPRVRQLIQRGLAAAGFDPGAPDGVFGEVTRAAIRAWQTERGETPTGYLDRQAATNLQRAGEQQQRLDETQRALRETQQERDAAQQAAEDASQAQQRAEQHADVAQEQAAADRAQYVRWIAVVAVATSAVALIFWVVNRRSVTSATREQARAEAASEAARSDLAERDERERLASQVPAVFLDGADADGQPIALRVPGVVVAGQAGAVVGRNPFDSTVVLDHAEVSRRHFRLFARGTSVMIEDLNSTNGTTLNDVELEPGTTAVIEGGVVLSIGGLRLTVTLHA